MQPKLNVRILASVCGRRAGKWSGGPLPFRQECLRSKDKGLPGQKGRSPAVWVSCSGLLIGEELAVGTVGEQVTGPQVQGGDLVGGDVDLAQAARERRGLVELKQLDIASRRELFADATESFNFRFHSTISSARF